MTKQFNNYTSVATDKAINAVLLSSTKLQTIFLALIFLSGCSIRCHENEIYNHKIISNGNVKTSIKSDGVSQIEINEWATIKINGSSFARENRSGLVSLEIRVEDGHTFQFKSNKVDLLKEGVVHQQLPMGEIKYHIFTIINPDGTKVPDSSTAPPTSAVINLDMHSDNGHAQNDYYSFDTSAKFVGSYSKMAPAFELAVSKIARRRPYQISFEIPLDIGNKFVLSFPNAVVDNTEFQMPVIEFNGINKSICHDYH